MYEIQLLEFATWKTPRPRFKVVFNWLAWRALAYQTLAVLLESRPASILRKLLCIQFARRVVLEILFTRIYLFIHVDCDGIKMFVILKKNSDFDFYFD